MLNTLIFVRGSFGNHFTNALTSPKVNLLKLVLVDNNIKDFMILKGNLLQFDSVIDFTCDKRFIQKYQKSAYDKDFTFWGDSLKMFPNCNELTLYAKKLVNPKMLTKVLGNPITSLGTLAMKNKTKIRKVTEVKNGELSKAHKG